MLSSAAMGMGAYPQQPLFTAAQWAELEQQALIYKYLTAGVPVPPDLLIPMRPYSAAFSFSPAAGAASSLYHHHPSLSYYAYYGKKLDPEPWRCRRTDGKKWRCSKEAHPDSKYCERHMHRGRNRSRKPVESSKSASSPQLSTVTSAATRRETEPRTHGLSLGGGAAAGSSQQLHHHLDASSFSLGANKADVGELSFMSGASAVNSSRAAGFTFDSSPSDGSSWQTSSMASASGGHGSFTLSGGYNYSNLEMPRRQQELGQVTIASLFREQQQQRRSSSFNGGAGGLQEEENQALRPFLDEWPAARDSWSEMDDARTSSFSTTQLSISIPRCT